MPVRPFRIIDRDYALGMKDNLPDDQLPDNAVVDALNVEFDQKSNLRTRRGLKRIDWNRNTAGANAFDFSTGWAGSAVVTANTFDDPAGTTTGDRVKDNDGAGALFRSFTVAGATAGDFWTVSVYVRVPVDPTDGGPEFSIPAIRLQYVGGSATNATVALVPDLSAANNWRVSPSASAEASGVGEVFVDGSTGWQWVQFYCSLTNDNNTSVRIQVYPAFNEYGVVAGPPDIISFPAEPFGQQITSQSNDDTGFWGAVIERGRFIPRTPNTNGSASALATNYVGETNGGENYYIGFDEITDALGETTYVAYSTKHDSIGAGALFWYDEANDRMQEVVGTGASLALDQYYRVAVYQGAGWVHFWGTTHLKIALNPGGAPTITAPFTSGSGTANVGHVIVWNDRLVGIGGGGVLGASFAPGSYIVASKLGDPTDWDDTNFISGAASLEIGGQETGPITALMPSGASSFCT
jgi:hypothetical protein